MLKTPHHTQVKFAAKFGMTIVVISETEYQIRNGNDAIILRGSDLKALLVELEKTAKAEGHPATKVKTPRKAKVKKATKRRASSDDEGEEGDESEGDDTDEEGEEGEKSRSVVKSKYKAAYAQRALKGTCSDAMAKAFAAFTKLNDEGNPDPKGELDMGRVRQVAADNGVSLKGYKTSGRGWQGRQRMTLGNMLRGMIRNGSDVKVGSQKFSGDEVKPKAKKARAKKS